MRNGFSNHCKMVTILFCVGLLLAFVLGCSSGGGDGDSDQSLTITGESGNQVNLNGTWNSECDEMDLDEYKIAVTTISGSNFLQTENQWFDAMDCSGTSDLTVIISGAFVLGNEVTAELNGLDVTVTEMDLVINSVEGTINNPNVVADFNAAEEYDFDDWIAGTPKELLGKSCGPDDVNVKDVLYVDDTADPDVLYFGDEDGPNDGNDYPAEIESDEPQECS